MNDKSTNDLISTIGSYYKTKDLCPDQKDVFRAFKEVDYSNLKVVVIGQDPYHDGKSACGLAFANSTDKKGVSPSLKRILNETPNKGYFTDKNLSNWTSQGVLLLNTALTVEKGKPGSHVDLWKNFTKNTITSISNLKCIKLLLSSISISIIINNKSSIKLSVKTIKYKKYISNLN